MLFYKKDITGHAFIDASVSNFKRWEKLIKDALTIQFAFDNKLPYNRTIFYQIALKWNLTEKFLVFKIRGADDDAIMYCANNCGNAMYLE